MKINKKLIFCIGFNIIETFIIYMIGKILSINSSYIIILMVTFLFTRLLCGKPKHYNKWYRCFIWSALTFTSVYALTGLNIFATILLTIFSGFIATGRADIKDIYQWKGTSTNYTEIEKYVKDNSCNPCLVEFENKLKEKDEEIYKLYRYRFKDNMSFSKIAEKLDLDNPRIVEKLNMIAFSMKMFCNI